MKQKQFSRKDFLKTAVLGVVSLPFLEACEKDSLTENQGVHCGFTDGTNKGPFFVKNTAETVNINFTNLTGTPIKVQGIVYGGEDGETLIPNAKIEIWQADEQGVYHPEGNGKSSKYDESEIALRGHFFTNEKGEYSFTSIKPGLYGSRSRHLHFGVTADGHRKLFTETYWLSEKGDNRDLEDRTNSNREDCRYIDFQDDGNGGEIGEFNIYLRQRSV